MTRVPLKIYYEARNEDRNEIVTSLESRNGVVSQCLNQLSRTLKDFSQKCLEIQIFNFLYSNCFRESFKRAATLTFGICETNKVCRKFLFLHIFFLVEFII